MIKQILNLEGAQNIDKAEQKIIKSGIPECWIHAIEAGCVLIPVGGICPLNTSVGICDSNRICC